MVLPLLKEVDPVVDEDHAGQQPTNAERRQKPREDAGTGGAPPMTSTPRPPSAAPAPAPDTLPRTKQGRVLWEQVSGFRAWIREQGPALTNRELVAAIHGAELSAGAVGSLRRSYGALESVETRRRAYMERDAEPVMPPEPELSPEEKMERALLRQQVQRLSARQTFYEIVGEKILAAIAKLPALTSPPPAPRPDCRALGEEEMALVVIDVQAGLKVDVKGSGGLGSYNTMTLLEQLAYLQRSVLSIHRYHPNVTVFHAMFLGDIVEGETIYGGQLREIDQGVIDQALFSIEHFARYLQALAGVFETVHCYGVIGNHGRIGRRGEHGPRSNFDYLVYRILAEAWPRSRTSAGTSRSRGGRWRRSRAGGSCWCTATTARLAARLNTPNALSTTLNDKSSACSTPTSSAPSPSRRLSRGPPPARTEGPGSRAGAQAPARTAGTRTRRGAQA
jgi:hypothetical protein